MNQRKIGQIKQLLKFEKRRLDEVIQKMAAEISKLNLILAKIESNRKQQSRILQSPNQAGFAINAAQSRNHLMTRMDGIVAQLKIEKSEQEQVITEAKNEVAEQSVRVEAIKTLVKKLTREAEQKQIHFENSETYDNILTRSMGVNQ